MNSAGHRPCTSGYTLLNTSTSTQPTVYLTNNINLHYDKILRKLLATLGPTFWKMDGWWHAAAQWIEVLPHSKKVQGLSPGWKVPSLSQEAFLCWICRLFLETLNNANNIFHVDNASSDKCLLAFKVGLVK